MIPVLAMILIGWPAILASLAVSAVGIARRDAKWLLWGAILSIGFAWYLTGWGWPLVKVLGYLLPFLHAGGAAAVRRDRPWIAWMLLIPHAAIALWLGTVVLTQ